MVRELMVRKRMVGENEMAGNAHRRALNTQVLPERIKHTSHAGLLLSRYLQHPVKEEQLFPEAKHVLFDAAISANKNSTAIYALALQRWRRYINNLPSTYWRVYKIKTRLVVGLSSENVLEIGIALHHTYGVPLIPGTALKGLAAHYCDQVWGKAEDGTAFALGQDHHKCMFGVTDKSAGENGGESGGIVFHDAWWIPESTTGLVRDVITPHYREYYSGDTAPPSDDDKPNPITLLAVTGKFHVSVSCISPGPQAEKWLKLTMNCLTQALEYWGIGAKTNSGYGCLVVDTEDDSMPMAERLPAIVEKMSHKALATALSRDWKKTKKKYADHLPLFIELVHHYHGETIQQWKQAEGNKKKAYKRLFENHSKPTNE